MTDVAADARALLLFERLTDDPRERAALLSDEPAAVLAALAELEDAAPRARIAFPTEDDARPRRRALPLPDRIGAYRLAGKLGEGGMGLVFAASRADGLFDHEVAIKLIHPDRLSDRAMERFAQERRLLARLRHSGIAQLLDGGIAADGWPYIIMERIDGLALDAFAAEHAPTARARVALVEQVCDAVTAAHAALVVHGDIKPANVLVDARGRTRLLDFGVARLIEDQRPAGMQPLTVAFASPAMRGGAAPGVLDDVYALGILLRAVLGAGEEDAHLATPADPDLAAMAARAAARDAGARYRSVDALAADLARWQTGRPVEARNPTLRYVAGRFVMRHRRALAIAGIALAAMLLLGALAVAGWRVAEHRQALASERTGDMQKLARYQLLVLAGRLEHQPGSTLMRRDLAREAEDVLARAIAGGSVTPDLRRDAAEGYRLLARVEGAPDRPSLGRSDRAEAALIRAEALLEGDTSRAGRLARARLLLDHATIAAAGGDTDRASALLGRARSLAADGGTALTDDIALLGATTRIWNGDYAAALGIAHDVGGRHRGAPTSPDEALRHDRILDSEAEATFYLGDERGAADLYAAAVRAMEAARARWPRDVALDWALARQRWNLGTTLISLRRHAEALPLLRAASATLGRIAAEDPDDMVAARRLRSYDLATAQALSGVGQTEEAVDLLTANITARRRWAAASPGDTARQRDVAVAVAALGDVHAEAGQAPAACARYAEVHRIHAALARARRLSRLDSGYFAGLIDASERKLGCMAEPSS